MALPPLSSPKILLGDIRAFLGARQRHELIFAGFSIAIPAFLVIAFLVESTPIVYKAPTVIYAKNWNKGRTEAEIKRQQAIDAPGERAARKAEADFEAKKQQQFKDLQKALGI